MSTEGAIKAKLYRERNPERWNDSLYRYWKKKYTCECGAVICNKVRPQHKRSKKHIERMALIESVKAQYQPPPPPPSPSTSTEEEDIE